MVTVLFRCGCEGQIPDAKTGGDPPTCDVHRERIARVLTCRPPAIVGMAHGPHVSTRVMEPATPSLAETRLELKTGAQVDG